MRSKRVPDRVHVVRTPQQDDYSRDNHDVEIVRMLAQISDKLKRSEAERYQLLNELREYRKSLTELEDKAENTEKAFLTIEHKIQNKGPMESEIFQRQARLEKKFKESEEKIVKSIAGQAIIDRRLKETEQKQTMIDQRLDESVAEQTRIDRQLELSMQDKARITRKMERLEEIITETQDTLRAKAMVLLTDQSPAAQSVAALQAPAETVQKTIHTDDFNETSWWRKIFNLQTTSVTALIIAALLGGWTINQIQQPQTPEIKVLENGNLAQLDKQNNQWEDITAAEAIPSTQIADIGKIENEKITDRLQGIEQQVPLPAPKNTQETTTQNYDGDEELLAAINGTEEAANTVTIDKTQQADIGITEPMKDFEKIAYIQKSDIASAIAAEKSNQQLTDRVQPDPDLTDVLQRIETQALQGDAEAQHDLAAIYTAGHGGVDQNFEKAAFWFRESSDQGIGNARYNLGVLYHQGLGVERDLDRALYWYREAAKLGHAEAQYNLGIAHIEGIGTDYNPQLAAEFFERAANNGIVEAAYNLGLIHENGLLGTVKADEALLWYKIAANQGSADATNAMQGLADALQIGLSDVDALVERMQAINESVKGHRAGPDNTITQDKLSTTTISQIQEYLKLTGFYNGSADGIVGPKTQAAIRDYQEANALPVDGKPSPALLTSMTNEAIKHLEAQKQ